MADEKTAKQQAPKPDEARMPHYEHIFESGSARKKAGWASF